VKLLTEKTNFRFAAWSLEATTN